MDVPGWCVGAVSGVRGCVEEAWGTHLHAANLGCRVIRLIAVFRLDFITRRATTAMPQPNTHARTHTLVKL